MSREYQDYCNTNYTEADIPEPDCPSDGEIYAFVSRLGMTKAEIDAIDAAIERALCERSWEGLVVGGFCRNCGDPSPDTYCGTCREMGCQDAAPVQS